MMPSLNFAYYMGFFLHRPFCIIDQTEYKFYSIVSTLKNIHNQDMYYGHQSR